MRKLISMLLALILVFALSGAALAEEQVSGEITVWTQLTIEEVNSYIDMYNSINPNVKVTPTVFTSEEYMTKLLATLRAGVNTPDVVLLEIKHLGQIMNTDFLMNLSELGAEEYAANQVPYVAALSRDAQGNLKALSYQSCPGGFWFRKDLAKKYLGTDDPNEIAAMISDWDKIIEVGEKVYADSNGETALIDAIKSVSDMMLMNRTTPYADENGKLMDIAFFRNIIANCVNLREHNVDAKLEAWSSDWAANFYGSNAFILLGQPSWGLHYCIKANTPADATDTDNSWGFTYAPTAYRAGGTWAAVCAGTKNVEAAWDFARTITVNEEYLQKYVDKTGDMIGYVPAIEKIIESGFRDPFTGDQDIYGYMYSAAMKINAVPYTPYDDTVSKLLFSKIKSAMAGQMTVDEAAQSFMDEMCNNYPELTVG